jgi:hypothetical protein
VRREKTPESSNRIAAVRGIYTSVAARRSSHQVHTGCHRSQTYQKYCTPSLTPWGYVPRRLGAPLLSSREGATRSLSYPLPIIRCGPGKRKVFPQVVLARCSAKAHGGRAPIQSRGTVSLSAQDDDRTNVHPNIAGVDLVIHLFSSFPVQLVPRTSGPTRRLQPLTCS